MIPVFTTAGMRRVDEVSIGGNPTIGYSYMLKAAMGIFETVKDIVPAPECGDIAIICGKGNNGGDGYVAGSLLLDAGYRVMCYSLCEVESLTGEAHIAYNEFSSRKGSCFVVDDVEDLSNLNRYALVIDAMLGTGVKGNPRGLYSLAIGAVNASGVKVLAVDTPSGLNNDDGTPGSPCIKADVTVTMGFPKLGQFFYPGKENVGKLIVKDLGYPEEVIVEQKEDVYLPDDEALKGILPLRKENGSKIDHGLAFLLCGSRGMTGAATLASLSALRSGCGMVHLAVPESLLDTMAVKVTEPVLHPILQTRQGTASHDALDQVVSLCTRMDAFCIGSGLSHNPQTVTLVRELIREVKIPIVLDADGINAFKDRADELKEHAGEVIITPHRGEWKRLFGELSRDPLETVNELKRKAAEFNVTILLKGNPTLVSSPDGKTYIIPFGDSSLATAGSGDVLSGIITSLIAQGCLCINAAVLGASIQGKAGHLAGKALTKYSVMAEDVVDHISGVFRNLTIINNTDPEC
ncbi:MAG: NAD(P)H-hydrate dehydratase [Chitinispirillaceae bacterium]